MHFAVRRAGVDVSAVRAALRGEVAADQRFGDAVPAVRDDGAVVRVRAFVGVLLEVVAAVVEVVGHVLRLAVHGARFGRGHFAQVPELHTLIFAVAEDVAAVAFAVDVRHAFCVAEEAAGCSAVAEGAAVPDFDGRIIGAGVEDVRGGLVAVADCVYFVVVGGDANDGFAGFEVVDVDRVAVCAAD